MHKKIRILIVTDSPVLPTGQAETTRLIFGGLLERHPDEYEIHQIGLFQCYACTTPKWPVYPTKMIKDRNGKLNFSPDDKYAEKTFFSVAAKVQPDIVFALGDPQNVLHLCLPRTHRRFKLILYINIDGLPLPPGFGPALSRADQIVTATEFAKDVLARCPDVDFQDKLSYIYSPADTQRFSPVTDKIKADMRRDLFPPWMAQDAFLLGWVGRNQWRKQIWVQYKVLHYLRTGEYLVCHDCKRISLFDWDPSRQTHLHRQRLTLESRPGYNYDACAHCGSKQIEQAKPLEDIFLWCHMADEPVKEWPTRRLEEQFAVQRGRDLYYTPEHNLKASLGPEDMPTLFRLWDCLLYLSGGEGFGIPAWEAMSCGIPSVYTDYSGHGELLTRAQAGIPVTGILQPEQGLCLWRMIADVPQTIEAVRRLYYDNTLRKSLGANARKYVGQFTVESLVEKWNQIFHWG
jgi:glycosyltransferase involved in cell wall biosynthesis